MRCALGLDLRRSSTYTLNTVESQSLARAGLVLSGRKNYAFARAGLTFARGRRYEHDTSIRRIRRCTFCHEPPTFIPAGGYGRACGGRGGGEQRRGGRRVKSNQRGAISGESTVESTVESTEIRSLQRTGLALGRGGLNFGAAENNFKTKPARARLWDSTVPDAVSESHLLHRTFWLLHR